MAGKKGKIGFSPLSHGLCRFCNTNGFHRTLVDEYNTEGVCELYSDMILECFNLHVTTGIKLSCLICAQCINRVKDSLDFRKMVIDSEIQLQKMLADKEDFEEGDELAEYLEIKSEADKADIGDLDSDEYTDYQVLEDIDISDVEFDEKGPTNVKIEIVRAESEEREETEEAEEDEEPPRPAYTEEDLKEATEAVRDGRMGYSEAARRYKVPKTTLHTVVLKLIEPERAEALNAKRRVQHQKLPAYTQEDLRKAGEAVRSRKMSNAEASRVYKVPRTTLATYVLKLSEPEKFKHIKTRKRPLRPLSYTEEQLRRAAEAVRSRKMSNAGAARHFKVPRTTLATYVLKITDPKKLASLKKKVLRPTRPTYSKEDLRKAAEMVRDLKMNNAEASRHFNVPKTTLASYVLKNYGTMADLRAGNRKVPGQPRINIMVKHNTNITTIMEFSNATPIRCYRDAGYCCSFCKKQYPKPEDLKYHTIHAHDMATKRKFTKGKTPSAYYVKLDITRLKCNICDAKIDSLERLMHHLNVEHDKKMYTDIQNRILPVKFETDELKCVICGHVFSTFKILLMHMNVHYPNYVCKVCNAAYLTRTILIGHEKCHKTGVFKCDKCPKVFDNERTMKIHYKHVHVYSGYISRCGHCGEKFKSYHHKVEHLRKVHNITKALFSCKACDRTFRFQALLRLHWKRVHLMERPIKCDDCDMNFFNKMSLKKHRLKHTGIRRFQCEYCLKTYQTKAVLREHLRIHENDRRFKCEHCGMAFVQKCSWRAHLRNKHGVVS